MKLIMVLGGFIGFAIGFGFSLAQGSAWPTVVWRAAGMALLAGLLLRWWGRCWMRCLRDSHQEKQAIATATSIAAVTKNAETPSTPAKK